MSDSNGNGAIPASVLNKLLALDSIVIKLNDEEITRAARIEDCHNRLSGRIINQNKELRGVEQNLNSLLVEQRAAKSELHSAQTVRLACRMFVDRLPPGARLEPVTLNGAAEGKTLADIRAEIAAVRAELATLRSAPTPSPDIRNRVESYVASLGAPTVRGIGAGEVLRIIWPGARETLSGPDERTADPLALFAILFPQQVADG